MFCYKPPSPLCLSKVRAFCFIGDPFMTCLVAYDFQFSVCRHHLSAAFVFFSGGQPVNTDALVMRPRVPDKERRIWKESLPHGGAFDFSLLSQDAKKYVWCGISKQISVARGTTVDYAVFALICGCVLVCSRVGPLKSASASSPRLEGEKELRTFIGLWRCSSVRRHFVGAVWSQRVRRSKLTLYTSKMARVPCSCDTRTS
ncbi:hypothetical protein PROFUN_00647 [Planoprotostelium fungivorum]|uniref:Uncharacterized protein n=1 Tax=Planoprotostelium fungivorum TaxID=1890364 RepID=A0A2P6NU24_9EUKA|nr:hypothetical protein PROFUN_00647 [Planoprotostelium fungivorum]